MKKVTLAMHLVELKENLVLRAYQDLQDQREKPVLLANLEFQVKRVIRVLQEQKEIKALLDQEVLKGIQENSTLWNIIAT